MTSNQQKTIPCFSCGALVPNIEGPVHRYMDSSPGCWALFGEVLAREYTDYRYAAYHLHTVNAYAIQHPGRPSPQSIQSVAVHLVSFYLLLERGLPTEQVTYLMQQLTKDKSAFIWLEPPEDLGQITVLDLWQAQDAEAHGKVVTAWAASAWTAWAEHHPQVKVWAEAYA